MSPNASRVSFHALTRLYRIIEIYAGVSSPMFASLPQFKFRAWHAYFPLAQLCVCTLYKRKWQTLLDTPHFRSCVVYYIWEWGRGLRIFGARWASPYDQSSINDPIPHDEKLIITSCGFSGEAYYKLSTLRGSRRTTIWGFSPTIEGTVFACASHGQEWDVDHLCPVLPFTQLWDTYSRLIYCC